MQMSHRPRASISKTLDVTQDTFLQICRHLASFRASRGSHMAVPGGNDCRIDAPAHARAASCRVAGGGGTPRILRQVTSVTLPAEQQQSLHTFLRRNVSTD
jgi:hypothetical protein